MLSSGKYIWNTLYNSTGNVEIRNFLTKIPHEDFNDMSLESAKQYVINGYRTKHEIYKRDTVHDINVLTETENPLKFDLHKSNKPVCTSETGEYEKVANKLIQGCEVEKQKIQGLQLKTTNSILKQLELLPKNLNSFIDYESVTLPKKSILLDSRNKNINTENSTRIQYMDTSQYYQIDRYTCPIKLIDCKKGKCNYRKT